MKTAVVTGAAGGLGAELVRQLRQLRQAGYRVVPVDIHGLGEPAGGDPSLPVVQALDVRDAAACRALAERERPAVWINCAGVLGPGDAATQPDEVIERLVSVNLLGVVHGTRAAVASMRPTGGHVINIASLAAWVPVPGETVYAATKAAALSFTLGLRAELQAAGVRDIHLCVVCPDGMLTPMLTAELDNPAIALSFSGPRLVTVSEVAAAALRLLERPKPVVSVPRRRGFQVRALGAVADRTLGLAPLFVKIGRRNQGKAR